MWPNEADTDFLREAAGCGLEAQKKINTRFSTPQQFKVSDGRDWATLLEKFFVL
jgi:hypothetical protein